ncbi:MAG TPA: hypothetical protein VIL74_09025 [Pyrinomonadaceae bacterium]|jgi:hypothetical protein
MKNEIEDTPVRYIETHKISKLNRDNIVVRATDEKDSDGANHEYAIIVCTDKGIVSETAIKFQKGGLKETGVNGITDQSLIAIVLDRMVGFQAGPYASVYNEPVIDHLKGALGEMAKRYDLRATLGIEGERVPDLVPPQPENEFLLQFFAYEHLPETLQAVSKPFGDLARDLVAKLPRNPERTVALRKLLEAKDCAVRALVAK